MVLKSNNGPEFIMVVMGTTGDSIRYQISTWRIENWYTRAEERFQWKCYWNSNDHNNNNGWWRSVDNSATKVNVFCIKETIVPSMANGNETLSIRLVSQQHFTTTWLCYADRRDGNSIREKFNNISFSYQNQVERCE